MGLGVHKGFVCCKLHCCLPRSDILGARADIHTGGVDLKFPHHDNEIAQAEVSCDEGRQTRRCNWPLPFLPSCLRPDSGMTSG